MKYCKGCNQEKDFSQFAKVRQKVDGSFTYATLCNACNYAKYKEYYSRAQKERKGSRRFLQRCANDGCFNLVLCDKKKKHCSPECRKESGKRAAVERGDRRRNSAAYRKRLRAIPGAHTDREWEELKAKYSNACLCCGKVEPEIRLTRDHVLPITKGGTDNIDNIQPLCVLCNSSKNDKHVDYR